MASTIRDALRRWSIRDLTIAVLLGYAVWQLVGALVNGLIVPLIASRFDKQGTFDLIWTVNGASISMGFLLGGLLELLIILTLVWLIGRATDEVTSDCPHCLSVIPLGAQVCAFCTRDIEGASASADAT